MQCVSYVSKTWQCIFSMFQVYPEIIINKVKSLHRSGESNVKKWQISDKFKYKTQTDLNWF